MTTPPHRLQYRLLDPSAVFDLREATGELAGTITAGMALALARSGMIEGVGKRPDQVRYLRYLRPDARPDTLRLEECVPLSPVEDSGRSTAFARIALGVYRQALKQPIIVDGRVVGEGDIIGHCYAFSALRHFEESGS
jgi:hypothetical protein